MKQPVLTLAVYTELFEKSDKSYHNKEKKAHLWEHIGLTLMAAGEYFAFITLSVETLFICIVNPLHPVRAFLPKETKI